MGQLVKLTLFVAAIALGGFAYYMVYNDLDPLDAEDIKKATSSTQSKLEKISDTLAEKNSTGKEEKVYKRKDAEGNWYYTNEPPEDGEEADTIIYRTDTNVLPPLPEDDKKKK